MKYVQIDRIDPRRHVVMERKTFEVMLFALREAQKVIEKSAQVNTIVKEAIEVAEGD